MLGCDIYFNSQFAVYNGVSCDHENSTVTELLVTVMAMCDGHNFQLNSSSNRNDYNTVADLEGFLGF